MTKQAKFASCLGRMALVIGSLTAGASALTAAELKMKDFVPSFFGSSEAKTEPSAVTAQAAQRSLPAASGEDEVLARIGKTELRVSDLRSYLTALSARDRAALTQNPAALSELVRTIQVNQVLLQQALAKQWDQQPENAALLKLVRDSAISEAYLQSVSKPNDGYPSDAELQKAYEANKAALAMPRQYQLAQIYVAIDKNAGPAAKDKANQKVTDISEQLRQPNADFAAIARADSDAKETGQRGGDIGWVAESQLRPEVKTLIIGLAKGGVTDPVQVDDGWQFIKVLDVKEPRTLTLAEVRDQLSQRLREQQAALNRRAFVADLLKQNPPAINELGLSKALSGGNASTLTSSTQ